MTYSATTLIQRSNLVIVKVGSSLVTNSGKGIDLQAIKQWAAQIAQMRQLHKKVIMVSSGAVAEGMARLGWQQRPKQIDALQCAAAVGQVGLAQAYAAAFSEYHIHTAQILLTHEDLADRNRYINARYALNKMLDEGVLPIVNENDTIATEAIKLGDNDTVGALVANLLEAGALIILTDQVGLFDSDPRHNPNAKLLRHVKAGDPSLEKMAGGAGTHVGTGGMLTKVLAAKRAARSGTNTIIASGHEPNVLVRLAQGEHIGTELHSATEVLSARKQWLANHLHTAGRLTIDDGAVHALTQRGTSLLPVGVTAVDGEFKRGDVVSIHDANGHEIARGLSNFSSSDARRIMRKSTTQIEEILGGISDYDIVHRNNMILASFQAERHPPSSSNS
ncbi:glutamate 5-kinase [Brackiella oedipodis]|uniref:glutamate 5-kinase n=1 Tax=Brackiella oedipodis TaxID=124225 RepID=UPI00056EA08F|nr:glutamate 5-kinase [Brackiella oedipodis]